MDKHEVEVGVGRDDGADEVVRGHPHPALDLLRCFFLLLFEEFVQVVLSMLQLFCITWTEFSPVILA